MFKIIFRFVSGYKNVYSIISNALRNRGKLIYPVTRVNSYYTASRIPVTWLSFFALFRGHVVSNPVDSKKKLDSNLAIENLIAEADDLFNENKYVELYELLLPYKECNDVEILWRLSRVMYNMSCQESSKQEKKRLIFEGYEIIERALKLNEAHYAVHKWYSVFLDARAASDGIKARVTQLPTVKRHMIRATELNPTDATTLHMLGVWCFNISAMPWYQRKIASAIFATPPTSSFEEALHYFSKAEEVDPNFYSQNLLMLGKTYMKLQKDEKARFYLKLASLYPAHTDDDLHAKREADELLKNLNK